MRKIFLALTAMTLMLTGCSGSDDSSSVNNNNNNNNNNNPTFESTILIDGEGFSPSNHEHAVTTSVHEGADGQTMRVFSLVKQTSNIQTIEMMQVSIIYPTTQSNVNGTYTFDFFSAEEDIFAQGMYSKGQVNFWFENGTVTVTDLGDDKFKLQFNNAIMKDFDEVETKTVTGYFEGTFELHEQ